MENHPFDEDSYLIELVIFECFSEEDYIFYCQDKTYAECFEQFGKTPIFVGLNIYKAETEIEVLYE